MTRIDSILLVLSGLLTAEGATAQADARFFFEQQVLATSNQQLETSEFTILGPTLVKGDGAVDSTVELRFAPREGQPLRVTPDFLAALIHNIELDPQRGNGVWRLRRARFECEPAGSHTWSAKELIFGCRHDGDDGLGPVVPLPRALPAIWHLLRQVVGKQEADVRWRSVQVDMTGERLQMTAEVLVCGDQFRKRFLALETALGDECKDPKGPFVEARWRGDETPAADQQGATFTLDLRPRRQLEREARPRRR